MVTSKFVEYRPVQEALVRSFEDLLNMGGEFEHTTVDDSAKKVTCELLLLSRGFPNNLMILCKCMKSRVYLGR